MKKILFLVFLFFLKSSTSAQIRSFQNNVDSNSKSLFSPLPDSMTKELWEPTLIQDGAYDRVPSPNIHITYYNKAIEDILNYKSSLDTNLIAIAIIELDSEDSLSIIARIVTKKYKVDSVSIKGNGYRHVLIPEYFMQNEERYLYFKIDILRYCRHNSAIVEFIDNKNQRLEVEVILNSRIANQYIKGKLDYYLNKYGKQLLVNNSDTTISIDSLMGETSMLIYSDSSSMLPPLLAFLDSNIFSLPEKTIITTIVLNSMFESDLGKNIIRPIEFELDGKQVSYIDLSTNYIDHKLDKRLINSLKKSEKILLKLLDNNKLSTSTYGEYGDKLNSVYNLFSLGQNLKFSNSLEKEYLLHLSTLLYESAKKTKKGKVFYQDFYEILSFTYKYHYLYIDTSQYELSMNKSINIRPTYTCSINNDFMYQYQLDYTDGDDNEYSLPKNYIVFVKTKDINGLPIENLSVKWSMFREKKAHSFVGTTSPTLQKFAKIVYWFWVEDSNHNTYSPKTIIDFDDGENKAFEKGLFTRDKAFQYLFPININLTTDKYDRIQSFLKELEDYQSEKIKWFYFKKIELTLSNNETKN